MVWQITFWVFTILSSDTKKFCFLRFWVYVNCALILSISLEHNFTFCCQTSNGGNPQSSGLKSRRLFRCCCATGLSAWGRSETQTHFMLALRAASTPRGASSKTRTWSGWGASWSGVSENLAAANWKIAGSGLASETWKRKSFVVTKDYTAAIWLPGVSAFRRPVFILLLYSLYTQDNITLNV